MYLAEIKSEVRERVGELTADFFSDAEVLRAINDGVRRFNAAERWPWLYSEATLTLARGTDPGDVELPQDISISRTFSVNLNSPSLIRPQELERVDSWEGLKMRNQLTSYTGKPFFYYLVSAYTDGTVHYTIRLAPVADVDYDIELSYMRAMTDMSNDTDSPDIPNDYQDAVPAWAAYKLFLKEMSISQKAQEQLTLYAQVLESAKNDLKEYAMDEVIAWGRDRSRVQRYPRNSAEAQVYGRIPPTLGP